MSETFVLIHGSWHGGWARQAVICNLSAKGHHAHAPTLAGHGLGVIRAGITHPSRIIRMLHHSPTRSRLREMGQAILPKLLRCISKTYSSDYHCARDMPTGFALALPCNLRSRHSRSSDLFAYTKSATNVFTKRRL